MKKFTLKVVMIFLSSLILFSLGSYGQEPSILVVDRDGSSWAPDAFTDVWPIFEEALIDNDYDYEYWEVINAEDNGPDYVYMGDFDMVIWFTGEVWAGSSTLTFDDEINLMLYLFDGGNLFLSAQDYLYDVYYEVEIFEEGQFPYDYLGLREVVQDVWNIDMPDLASVDGVAGSLAEGMEFELQDLFTTGREGLFIDNIIDHVGTDMFMLWDPAPEGIIGVQYETDLFKTVFTTGSYACIVDYDARMELMVNIVDFLTGSAPPPVCYPYFDDFESYTAGGYLAEQGDCWTTWSGTTGGDEDAFVVDEQAYSGANSVKVEGSSTDLIFPLGNKTEGHYEVSMYLYVESGYGGYYNLMHEFGDYNEWAIQIYFASDGSGYIHAGGANAATFTYPVGTWFKSVVLVNLDSDYAELWINDVFVHGWQWSLQSGGDPGLNQLGVVDIFAAAPSGDSPMFFFDDFEYKEAPLVCYPYFDDFESYTTGGYLAEQGDCWTTWSGTTGGDEDAFVVDEQAYGGVNSVKVEGSSTDLIFPLGNKIEGQYEVSMYLYVESGYGGYYNLMHEFGDYNEWAIQIYFASDGSGYIHAGGANAATFTYPVGTWFKSVMLVNLNSDYAELWINDVFVHGWQWSLESFGDPGLNQLGVVDIFADAPTGDSPMFFFDDFEYKEATGVGINNHITSADITMFPNPAYDQVEISSLEIIKEVTIFNNMGQMVLNQASDNSRVVINISNYPTGIYTVQIKTENGIKTEKLLIK